MSVSTGARKAIRRITPDPVYRLYRKRRIDRIKRRYRPRIVSHTYVGVPLQVRLGDTLSEGWYDHDWAADDMPEIRLLQTRIGAGSTVFDIGAHQGVVALILSRTVGPTGCVVAVEAERHNARYAEENARLNNADNIKVVHAAVADEPGGTVLFAEGLNGKIAGGGRAGKVRVPTVTVDELAAAHGHPDAVLVDVEGAEHLVLRGAAETIRRGATFVIEVHAGCGLEEMGGSPDALIEAFDDRYELGFLPEGAADWTSVRPALDGRTHMYARPA